MSEIGPGGPPDPFGDVPLFREIQRVLAASTGPVNWELARQVAIATASSAGPDLPPGDEDRRGLSETVRAAELAVAELTGLSSPSDIGTVRALRRAEWVQDAIGGLREPIDLVAAKLSTALRTLPGMPGMPGLPELPESGEEGGGAETPFGGAAGLEQILQGMGPLLMGAQVGSVLGDLAGRVLSRHDLPVPQPTGGLAFVVTNLSAFERDWSVPPLEFRAWVALHEVAHRFAFAGSWVRPHFVSLLRDLIEHAEVDLSGLQRAMEQMDPGNPAAMAAALEEAGSPFGTADTAEQRLRLQRVQAFVAATEAWADHVTEVLGRRMLPAYARIDEALRRHREGRHSERALERLFGIEATEEQGETARAFCSRVAEETDEPTLAAMWRSAEALPSTPELEEPTLWLARTV